MITKMTEGKPLNQILRFFWPLLFSTLFTQLYSITDSVVVGRFISKNALAAVNSTGSLNWMIISFIIGFVTGEGVLVARAFGENNERKMRSCIANGIYVSAAAAIIITAAALISIKSILVAMDVPKEIFSDTYIYIFTVMCGYPISIASNYIGMLIRSVGDGQNALIRGIISTIVNIVTDIVFVVVFHMGVFGVAIATVFAEVINFLVAAAFYAKKYKILHISKADFKFDKKIVLDTIKLGLPTGLQSSITMIGCTIIQAAINGLGTSYMAAFTTATKIENMLMTPIQTLTGSLVPFIGQNHGANRIDRIEKANKQVCLIVVIYGIIVGAVFAFFGHDIALMYLKSSEVETLSLVSYYCKISGSMLTLLCLLYFIRNVVQALGYAIFTAIGGVIELVTRLFVAFVLIRLLGYTAICLSNPLSWLFTTAFLFLMYFTVIKRHLKPLKTAATAAEQ